MPLHRKTGRFLKKNLGKIGSIAGAYAGSFVGMPGVGASLGGRLGGALQGRGGGGGRGGRGGGGGGGGDQFGGVGLAERNNESRLAIQSYMDQVMNPNFGGSVFENLASRNTPGFDTYAAMNSQRGARGGGGVFAREQFEGAQQSNLANAYQQYQQFSQNIQAQTIPGLLGMQQGQNQFDVQADLFVREGDKNRRADRINAGIQGALGLVGTIGGAWLSQRGDPNQKTSRSTGVGLMAQQPEFGTGFSSNRGLGAPSVLGSYQDRQRRQRPSLANQFLFPRNRFGGN
jgi:hypothetical protein